MSLAKFSTQQAVLTNLLFLLCLAAGGIVYRLLPVDIYPDISLDGAFIQTPYLGASPEDVEQHITKKIEEEIDDIPGVSRMASYSVPNSSNVFVKFREDLGAADFEAAYQELRARLDRVVDLPEEAEEPLLTRLTLGEVWPIVQVVICNDGRATEQQVRAVARDLKHELKQLDGVLKLREVGLRDREIHILLNKQRLEEYQLSLPEVAAILQSSNLNIPVGNVITNDEDLSVRAVGDVLKPDELGQFCIKKSPIGAHVYLRDIAEIREDFQREVVIGRFMGQRSAFLYVAKEREADSITVRNSVETFLDGYRKRLPDGIDVTLFADSTRMISSRLDVLKKNLGVGIVLVFIVLWMFIGARNSILAIVGIPFAFLCAFIFMFLIEVSINAVSVFALVLVSGLIVDDAIVVIENIYRHLQRGKPLREAIVDGADEVAWPVISSALTTMAAFLPLLVMTGVVGRFFSIIPKTVTVALLASLFECLIVLPSHFLHWGPRYQHKEGTSAPGKLSGVMTRLTGLFRTTLDQMLNYRYLFLGVIVAMAACAYQASRTLAVELFPSDFPTLVVTYNIHPEAGLTQTAAVSTQLTTLLDEHVEAGTISSYSSAVGVQWNEDNQMRQRTNIAQIWVELNQQAASEHDPEDVLNDIRVDLANFTKTYPELNIENLKAWPVLDGPPIGKPVALRIEHPDYEVAREWADRIQDRLRSIDGVFDVSDNFDIGQREMRLSLREEAASEFGLTFRDVFSTVSAANEGLVIGTFNDRLYDEDLDIRVKFSRNYRSSEDHLLDIDLKTPAGAQVKLRQVAEMTYDQGYANHFRFNGHRAILVTADVHSEVTDADRVARTILDEFTPMAAGNEKLTIVPDGQFQETHDSFRSLAQAGAIAALLMYLIMAAQFKNYVQPVVILVSLVFGAIGMIMGLVLNSYPFSVVSGIAMIGLFGIVVNDAIVLITFINNERGRGLPLRESLIEASVVRFRPIMLTTLTTTLGLLPMALGVGGYNKIWSPFATSICWGLITATVLIVLLLPSIYMIVDETSQFIARLFKPEDPTPSPSSPPASP
jgi:HAE1 family hydrophobic/amphiphilic exporter-1